MSRFRPKSCQLAAGTFSENGCLKKNGRQDDFVTVQFSVIFFCYFIVFSFRKLEKESAEREKARLSEKAEKLDSEKAQLQVNIERLQSHIVSLNT